MSVDFGGASFRLTRVPLWSKEKCGRWNRYPPTAFRSRPESSKRTPHHLPGTFLRSKTECKCGTVRRQIWTATHTHECPYITYLYIDGRARQGLAVQKHAREGSKPQRAHRHATLHRLRRNDCEGTRPGDARQRLDFASLVCTRSRVSSCKYSLSPSSSSLPLVFAHLGCTN